MIEFVFSVIAKIALMVSLLIFWILVKSAIKLDEKKLTTYLFNGALIGLIFGGAIVFITNQVTWIWAISGMLYGVFIGVISVTICWLINRITSSIVILSVILFIMAFIASEFYTTIRIFGQEEAALKIYQYIQNSTVIMTFFYHSFGNKISRQTLSNNEEGSRND